MRRHCPRPLIVVADTSPLNYLILIDQAELLAALFRGVLLPPAVVTELEHPRTPEKVRAWMANPPAWISSRAIHSAPPTQLMSLDLGVRSTLGILERAARLGRVDFRAALSKLEATNFRISPALKETLLRRNA